MNNHENSHEPERVVDTASQPKPHRRVTMIAGAIAAAVALAGGLKVLYEIVPNYPYCERAENWDDPDCFCERTDPYDTRTSDYDLYEYHEQGCDKDPSYDPPILREPDYDDPCYEMSPGVPRDPEECPPAFWPGP